MEVLSRGFRESMFKTQLKAYVEVEIIASQFRSFDNLVSYISWFTKRLSTSTSSIRPHSFELCLNSYHLKEEMVEGHTSQIFVETLGLLF